MYLCKYMNVYLKKIKANIYISIASLQKYVQTDWSREVQYVILHS